MGATRPLGTIRPFGEGAILVEVADMPGAEAARSVHALAAAVGVVGASGVRSVTPGLTSLLVEFDPLVVERRTVEAVLRASWESAVTLDAATGRHRSIPVAYGGEHGPDLEDVAELTGLTAEEVVARHAATRFEVYLLGFSPGFPYMGEMPAELQVPRLATPRTRTAAGSVAITGPFSGIYPVEAPGGWRVIGRTSLQLFDPERTPPAYLLPGDVVTFRAVEPDELEASTGLAPDW